MTIGASEIFAGLLALLLLIAAFTDLRTRTIPNRLNAAIAVLAIGWWWASGTDPWPDIAFRIAGALVVFLIFAALFAAGMMGGGDVKMIGALALWLPFALLSDMLMVMALAGGVLTLMMLARHRFRKLPGNPEIPYGVAISFAGLWVIANGLLTINGS